MEVPPPIDRYISDSSVLKEPDPKIVIPIRDEPVLNDSRELIRRRGTSWFTLKLGLLFKGVLTSGTRFCYWFKSHFTIFSLFFSSQKVPRFK